MEYTMYSEEEILAERRIHMDYQKTERESLSLAFFSYGIAISFFLNLMIIL